MSHIKLLRLLIEAEEETSAASTDSSAGSSEEQEIKNLLKQDYTTFVNKLKVDVKDKKFQDAIKSLASKNKIAYKEMSIPVSQLKPTQNEIDVNKSLKFPLTNAGSAEQCMKGGTVFIAGKRIITAGGGKYIIDGHHRWSQLCAMNPDAEIAAVDLSDIKDPFKALKATQLGIAADLGKIDTQSVKGENLLAIDKSTLKNYVKKTILDDVANVMMSSDKMKSFNPNKSQEEPAKDEKEPVAEGEMDGKKQKIANYIWSNVEKMKAKNQPVSGAPKRDFMPQTDDAKNWKTHAPDTQAIAERKILMKRAGINKK